MSASRSYAQRANTSTVTAILSDGRITSILVPHGVGGSGEGRVEHVEVAHHAPVVQPFALDDDLDAVVVSVKLARGSLDFGHHVEGPHIYRRADEVHIASRDTRRRG